LQADSFATMPTGKLLQTSQQIEMNCAFQKAEVAVQVELCKKATQILFASKGNNSSRAECQVEWLEQILHLNHNRGEPAKARRNAAFAWQETPHPGCQIQLIHLKTPSCK